MSVPQSSAEWYIASLYKYREGMWLSLVENFFKKKPAGQRGLKIIWGEMRWHIYWILWICDLGILINVIYEYWYMWCMNTDICDIGILINVIYEYWYMWYIRYVSWFFTILNWKKFILTYNICEGHDVIFCCKKTFFQFKQSYSYIYTGLNTVCLALFSDFWCLYWLKVELSCA